MSDHFYAVQFRAMRTAVHHVVIFSLESKANKLLDILKTTERFPDESEMEMEPGNYVTTVAMDFREVLYEYEDIPLVYVNQINDIPDVYDFS